jgi:importin subunit alpha-6/7
VQQIRRHLSKESNPPAKEIVDAGIVPILVRLIHQMDDPKTQFEAAWALTNVTSTEFTSDVVKHNAIPPLVHLLRGSKDPDVREQVVWCLGNIAGDGAANRDLVLNAPNAVHNLMLNLAHPSNLSMLRNATWTLSNMCRGKPRANIDIVKHFIPAVKKLIVNPDVEVRSDALWALSYISDGDNKRIDTVLKYGIVNDVVKALGESNVRVVTPALRT